MHEHVPDSNTDSDESWDEALDKAVRALPRELAPARDLWPALAARLPAQRQQRARRQTGLWVAAAALVALWFGTLPLRDPATPTGLAADAGQDALSLQLQAIHESTWAATLASLAIPGVPQQQSWDAAIDQILEALRLYPQDPYLLERLDHLYRQRLRALQQAAADATTPIPYY